MNGGRLVTLGALVALVCIGACAAAALVPALLAGGGFALVLNQPAGWQTVLGAGLVGGAAFWWWRRGRQSRSACGCRARAIQEDAR